MFTINSSRLSGRKSRHFLEAFLLNLVTRCHFFVTKITATSNRLKSRHTLLANKNIARVIEFLVMVVIRHGAFPVCVYSTDSALVLRIEETTSSLSSIFILLAKFVKVYGIL